MSDVIVIPGLIRNPVKLPESRPANSGIRLAGIAPKDREKLKAVIGNVLTEIAIPPGLK